MRRAGCASLSAAAAAAAVRHQSQSKTARGGSARRAVDPRGNAVAYKRPPPLDLMPTTVDHGAGTSAADPYVRRQPNQVSRPPPTTTIAAHSDVAAAHAVRTDPAALERLSLPLAEWLGERRMLQQYLEALRTPQLPVPPEAAALIEDVERRLIPEACEERQTDAAMAVQQWRTVAAKFTSDLSLFDKAAFEARCDAAAAEITSLLGEERAVDMRPVAAVLHRNAAAARNEELRQVDAFLAAVPLQFGSLAWQRFVTAVEAMQEELFAGPEGDSLRAMWEVTATNASMPAVTAPVALLLVTITGARRVANAEEIARVEAAQRAARQEADPASAVPAEEILHFASTHLPPLLARPTHRSQLLLRAHLPQLTEQYQRLSVLVAATDNNRRSLKTATARLVPHFKDMGDAASVVKPMMSTGEARPLLLEMLGHSPNAAVDMDSLFDRIDWATEHEAFALRLLGNETTAAAAKAVVSTAIRSSQQHNNKLLSAETLEVLDEVLAANAKTKGRLHDAVTALIRQLLELAPPQQLLAFLRASGVDCTSLETTGAEAIARNAREEAPPATLFAATVRAVLRRHPLWAKAGVVTPDTAVIDPASAAAVQTLLRVYLRLAYVPDAAAAVMAQRHRRRIGPVATEPFQFNYTAEVGYAESYDNLQYKQYDWQGWYQRMRDVHFRNVSVKAPLRAFRGLDPQGRPFIDHQTERRMRIVGGDRVAHGMVKLDSDRFEDRPDNMDFATGKLQELLSEAKKAQLGEEYHPTVEVKVRAPSGQTKMRYSLLDWDRVEKRSTEMFARYRDLKRRALFVSPTETWLKVEGAQTVTQSATVDETGTGYTVDDLFSTMGGDQK